MIFELILDYISILIAALMRIEMLIRSTVTLMFNETSKSVELGHTKQTMVVLMQIF